MRQDKLWWIQFEDDLVVRWMKKRTKAWTNPTSYRRLEDDHLDGDNDDGEEGDGDHGDQDAHIVQEDLRGGNTLFLRYD